MSSVWPNFVSCWKTTFTISVVYKIIESVSSKETFTSRETGFSGICKPTRVFRFGKYNISTMQSPASSLWYVFESQKIGLKTKWEGKFWVVRREFTKFFHYNSHFHSLDPFYLWNCHWKSITVPRHLKKVSWSVWCPSWFSQNSELFELKKPTVSGTN